MPVTDNFKDVEQALNYQKFRPRYPDSLYSRIKGLMGESVQSSDDGECRYKLAVDVGCGSGQATISLSSFFQQVIGVDPSEAQIAEAKKEAEVKGVTNISYRVGLAEQLDFVENGSVDLVTVAAALHWFDVEKFCEECRRILRPGGVIVAYTYGYGEITLLGTEQKNGDECREFYKELVTKYRDPQVTYVDEQYIQFVPVFEKYFSNVIRDTSTRIEWKYSLEGLKGFIKSLSMYQKYKQTFKDGERTQLDDCFERLRACYMGSPPDEAVLYTSDLIALSGRKQ